MAKSTPSGQRKENKAARSVKVESKSTEAKRPMQVQPGSVKPKAPRKRVVLDSAITGNLSRETIRKVVCSVIDAQKKTARSNSD